MAKTVTAYELPATPERLEPFSLAAIDGLVEEADRTEAFMPSVAKPEMTLRELLDKFQSDPHFQLLGYVVDVQPISFIVALSHGADATTLAIGPMYVGAAYRGQGLGRRQVRDFLTYAQRGGYRQVYTKTWSSNTASRHLFEDPALGFERSEIVPHDRANGDDSLGYLRQL